MPDFPSQGYLLPQVHTIWPGSLESLGSVAAAMTESVGWTGTTAWPNGANTAVFWPFIVERTLTVYQVGVLNGTAVSGNLDIGVYDINWSRLVSAGSTAMSGASTMQAIDVADTVLTPGYYFAAMNCSSATAQFGGWSTANLTHMGARGTGIQVQAVGATALPATATPANPTGTTFVPTAILFNRSVF